MSIDRISHLVYKGTTTEAIQFVQDCKSEEELFVFVYNYNWENGLATPRLVMANPVCSMEIALLLFFSGDGYTFLSEGLMSQESDDEWVLFMKHLYASIVARQYKAGKTAFKVPLTKVQIYKFKKTNRSSMSRNTMERDRFSLELMITRNSLLFLLLV